MQKNEVVSQKKAWYIVILSSIFGCSVSASFPQFSMTVSALSEKTGLTTEFLLTSDSVKAASIVLAMLCSGFFYKRFTIKTNFILALIFTALPQFLIPYTDSKFLFLFLKSMQGFSSIIFPVFLLIIMAVIKNSQKGFATALFVGIFYSGGGVGGTIAGIFISQTGWISSYFALGIIQIILGLFWIFTVNYVPKNSSHIGKKEKMPFINVLKNPTVWLLISAFISTTFVVQAITVDMPLFSQWLGYDHIETGKISTAITFGLLISCLVSGKISDAVALNSKNKALARILVMSIGPLIIILSSLLLIFTDLNSFGIFYVATLLFSFGSSWGLGTFYVILPEIFDDETLPAVTGITGGIGDLGMPAAPLLVGVVFGAKGFWSLGWSVCIVIALISLLACIALCFRKGFSSKQSD